MLSAEWPPSQEGRQAYNYIRHMSGTERKPNWSGQEVEEKFISVAIHLDDKDMAWTKVSKDGNMVS